MGLRGRTSPRTPIENEKGQEVVGFLFLHHSMEEKTGRLGGIWICLNEGMSTEISGVGRPWISRLMPLEIFSWSGKIKRKMSKGFWPREMRRGSLRCHRFSSLSFFLSANSWKKEPGKWESNRRMVWFHNVLKLWQPALGRIRTRTRIRIRNRALIHYSSWAYLTLGPLNIILFFWLNKW